MTLADGENLPARLPSPFATPPHPIAQRAAMVLQAELRAGEYDFIGHEFHAPGGGKMLGVLVVRDPGGKLGFIRASSGMLARSWRPAGLAPPRFDDEARDLFWPAGQRALDALASEIADLETGIEATSLQARFASLRSRHAARSEEIATRHRAAKRERAARREAAGSDHGELQKLSFESQRDRRERRELRRSQEQELAQLELERRALRDRIKDLKARRCDTSNDLLARLQAGYRILNARGERRELSSFYPGDAPGGSGDCAGPKLLGYAYENDLEPIAFAEFWWGASPVGGGRHAGQFYPACRGKCGPLLAFMMQGLDHEPAPAFGSETAENTPPPVVFEDDTLLAVDKPALLLSVPGASQGLRDSALTRLRDDWKGAEKLLQIHRLDRDTSGVMVFAKTRETHKAMQAMFANRSIEKRYVAWLDGELEEERGRVSLALRVDLEDRPRQLVDPRHGKAAVTDYEVLERRDKLTKVAFYPRTGRTHQLRVHAAHAEGLGAPILGDRLYGKPASRLYLHAESLCFEHPDGSGSIRICSPLPIEFEHPEC